MIPPVRSGFSQTASMMNLVKVSDQRRKESLTPFEEIPYTLSKKMREQIRPATGNLHHWIGSKKDTKSQLLANKPSAQTLLANHSQL